MDSWSQNPSSNLQKHPISPNHEMLLQVYDRIHTCDSLQVWRVVWVYRYPLFEVLDSHEWCQWVWEKVWGGEGDVWQVLLYYGKQTVHRLCTCMCVLLRTHQILYPRETFVRGEKHQLSREKKIDCSNENVESSLYRSIAVFHLLSLRGQFRKVEWRGLVYELSSGKLR